MSDSTDRTTPFSTDDPAPSTDSTAPADTAPTADRSLADRVDAVERALTADSDGDPVPQTTGVDPARVEALEADLADLRAAVDALRGAVTDLDREGTPEEADHATDTAATATDAAVTHGASRPGGDTRAGPEDRPEDLFAPTGRAIPAPDALSDLEGPPGGGPDEGAPRDDAEESPTGLLARVSETL
jgi:hypothetical protein